MDTPTLDRMKEVLQESQDIGHFLDWLAEQDIWLARYVIYEDGVRADYLLPIHESFSKLLHQYFDIDSGLEEEEKRTLIDEILAKNEAP